MRSLSGARNRTVLVIAGVITLVAAAWLLVVAFALVSPGQELGGLVAVPDQSTVAELIEAQRGWLLPTACVAAVLAVLIGLALLIAQIPSAPRHTQMRFTDHDGTVLATLEPQVLEKALVEHLEGVAGVVDSSLRVSGSTSALTVQGELTVADSAEVEWAVDEARKLLASDLETALGAAPQSIDLLVRLRSPRSSRRSFTSSDRDRVAVRQQG